MPFLTIVNVDLTPNDEFVGSYAHVGSSDVGSLSLTRKNRVLVGVFLRRVLLSDVQLT